MSEQVSISSVGSALLALDDEIEKLTRDAEQLFLRLNNIALKQRVCHETIKKLLADAMGGTIPQAPNGEGRFPELNHQGD